MGEHGVAISSWPASAGRYQRAEQALWDRFGLRPTEHVVPLASPRVRLRVLEFGSGKPLLLVHGTVGLGAWAPLIGSLPGRRCLVLERPGWGRSESVDFAGHDYRTFVADLLRGVIEELGIDHLDVAGGSIGNLWAMSLAERHPSRVDRIVLLGGGPVVPEVRVPPFIRALASPVGAIVVRLPLRRERLRSILRANGHDASLDDGRIPAAFIDWRLALANDTLSMRHERDMVRNVVRGSGWRPGSVFSFADLGRIQQPTLLLYGTADPTGSVEVWTRVVAAMPNAALRLLDGAGHQPWFEDAPGVGAEVSRFLAAPAAGLPALVAS